ncbi:MAG: ScyD/ScyE family protein [Vicinamibacterales bacterium]
MALALVAVPATAQVVQPFVTGLRAPIKLFALPESQLLVAEAGNGPNTGRVSFVDRDGRRSTIIDGLPSGFGGPGNAEPSGPSALLQVGRRLFVVISAGDVAIETTTAIPNPAVSSPLFSSVLLLEFPDSAGEFGFGFALPASAHAAIAAGQGVYLRNTRGESVRVSRLADFPDFVAEPTAAEPRNVRISNPFGIVGSNDGIAVVDASFNRVWTVAVTPTLGGPVALANFAPVPNTVPGLGGPVAEAVPAGIRQVGNDYLVSLLTGFPFGPGAASVWRVNRFSGATERVLSNLQTAVDVLPVPGTSDQFYVLEYSRAFLANGPGRLIRVDGTRGTSLVMADPLQNATSMALDTRTGDLFVTELAANRIVKVLVPK